MAFFGVYRGTVLDNADPGAMRRVKVSVEGREGWALVALAGPKLEVGSNVIVAFERGNADYPVILGRVA